MVNLRKSNQRRSYLINPKFQISVIVLFIGLTTIVLGIWLISNQLFFENFWQKGTEIGLSADHVYFKFLTAQRDKMNSIVIVSGAILYLFLAVFGLILSNKIAGPLYNLTMRLKEIRETKKLSRPIKFRQGDYFSEIANAANEAFESLKNGKS